MSDDGSRTNGFRIRTFNQDCDRLAVQSSVATTWFCSFRGRQRGSNGAGRKAWERDVGIAQKELVVLRPYQGKPEIELEGLGGPFGVLVVQEAAGGTTILRNGQARRFELSGALVIKTENWSAPGRDGAGIKAA
jgi:hypothetical protein